MSQKHGKTACRCRQRSAWRVLALCLSILAARWSVAQIPDAEKPVPILSGSIGTFSFVTGGQNLIEPIALGIPVLIGPHTFNFAEATAGAIAAGAARLVADADEMARAVCELLSDPSRRKAMGDAARTFHAAHQGAVQRLWNWLRPQVAVSSVGAPRNPTLPDRD